MNEPDAVDVKSDGLAGPAAAPPTPAPKGRDFRGGPAGPRAALYFVLAFAGLATALLAIYYFPYPAGGRVRAWLDAYLHGYASVAGMVLRVFEPHIEIMGANIMGRYSIRIVRTCDAMDVKILFLSAVLASSGPWSRRVVVGIGGVLIIFLVNIVRICSLYYIGIYSPGFFEFAHLELWPLLILAVAVGMFMLFLHGAARPARSVRPRS